MEAWERDHYRTELRLKRGLLRGLRDALTTARKGKKRTREIRQSIQGMECRIAWLQTCLGK